ncbi:MAG: hypothetical protein JNM42_14445 [Propionivibrio sp.]|uniref:hypothetical protein n=1 Tax=Propionivibrio sp. TaxID=2212460 RepID=UPI001A455D96|nr:hypothetical protein [Propionivibrio sp.]MBL8415635.1 hypothetical protein [Propionivibrio sp.]
MPPTLPRRFTTACLLFALISSAAVAEKLPENEIYVSQDENGIEIFSNIAPPPMPQEKNKLAARTRSTVIAPAELGGRSRIGQENAGQQAAGPGEISDSSAQEVAALSVDNVIQALQVAEEPQDH